MCFFWNLETNYTPVVAVGEDAGSRILKVKGSGKNRENYATLHNILQSKKLKEVGANKNKVGTGIRGYGKQEV